MLELADEAVKRGASTNSACAVLGISLRTLQRWRRGADDDQRRGPHRVPANALSAREREKILRIANEPEFRNLSPKQIVPRLADRGEYHGSESTFYRVLHAEKQMAHRGKAKAGKSHPPREHVATGPNQVFSWDITYLRTSVRGRFFYLYMVMDVWSRRIMGWTVHEVESDALAAELFKDICAKQNLDPTGIVLHSDNGNAMKGSTMLATLQRLGVVPSFSRPHVSDDNAFSEALFRTLKYRPEYPSRPFGNLDEARTWVEGFERWYNTEHRHSGIQFVTPEERHSGREVAVLAKRAQVYARARKRRPERWSRGVRDWTPIAEVRLNPTDHPFGAPAGGLIRPSPAKCKSRGAETGSRAAKPPTEGREPLTLSSTVRAFDSRWLTAAAS